MPLELGYVDVRVGITAGPPGQLHTFPLMAIVAAPPLNEQVPGNVLALLATNPLDVLPAAGADAFVAAVISRNDATGQAIEFLIGAGGLNDAEVLIRLNTSVFSDQTDYVAHPTPTRGESFVLVGARSKDGGPVPVVGAILGVTKGTEAASPRDVTNIKVVANSDQPRQIVVGQRREQTEVATFTSKNDTYRRAKEGDADGLLMEISLHDPTTDAQQWVHVDLSSPRAGDGPARPVVAAEAPGAGLIPTTGKRQYQVTWVHAHGNETAPSPPSTPMATTTGRIRVPLPVWVDPLTPGLTGPVVPEPIIRRRIYRTVTSPDGLAGEAFLVKEIANNTATEEIDDAGDDTLGEPLLTDMRVAYRQTLDRAGNQPGVGFAAFTAKLHQSSYEESATGTRQFRGTTYDVRLTGAPPTANVTFTTRPSLGRPRVTWSSSTPAGPAGVAAALVGVVPTGVAVTGGQLIDASLKTVPAAFGVDWRVRGATRMAVEVGRFDNTAAALDQGIGLVVVRAAPTEGARPKVSTRTAWIELLPDLTTFSVRNIRRVRLLLGLPHPTTPGHAVLDDGVVAEVELTKPDGPRPRSLRLLRDTLGEDGRSRIMARVGELPDRLVIDARPGGPDKRTAVALSGRLRRVMVLVQGAAELAAQDVTDGRRRDGIWIAVPEMADTLDVVLDSGTVNVTPTGVLRADLSLRSTTGIGPADLPFRQVQGTLSTTSAVEAVLPDKGAMSVKAKGGVSGRLGMSTRALSPDKRDHLAGVRAVPQAKALMHRADDDARILDDMTFRVLGLTGFALPADGSGDPFTGEFTANRANKAIRGLLRLTDERASSDPWDMAKARVVDLPESVSVTALTEKDSYRLSLNRPSGRVVIFAEPPIVPTDGARAGTVVGVGLAKADVDSLPTAVSVDLLGPRNDLFAAQPSNATPPSDWRRSGFRVSTDGELVVRGLQLVTVATVRPISLTGGPLPLVVPTTAFWLTTAASLLKLTPSGTFWLWTPAEPLPGTGASAGDWEDLSSWLGYKIEDPALMTLQIQTYQDDTQAIPRRWNNPGFSWLLQAEFQMKDYRGEVTVDADLWPEGDDDAGPGLWTLRVPDGAPFDGQVVFGNTGGWISNRPRIFAPFSL